MTVTVDPTELEVSETNERAGKAEADDALVESIESQGIDPRERPLVRPVPDGDEDEYEVVAGQRRVDAAVKADLDEIEVDSQDLDEVEARIASTRENYSSGLREGVSTSDRALALQEIWNAMGEDGLPSSGELGDRIGASTQTVSKWIEPLREGWEGTFVDPRSEDHDEVNLDEVGEATLQLIRNIDPAAEEQKLVLVKHVEQDSETQTSVREIKRSVEEEGDLQEYLETGELPSEEPEDDGEAGTEDQQESAARDTDTGGNGGERNLNQTANGTRSTSVSEPDDDTSEEVLEESEGGDEPQPEPGEGESDDEPEPEVESESTNGMVEFSMSFSSDYADTIGEAAEERDLRRPMLIEEYIQRGLEEDGFDV